MATNTTSIPQVTDCQGHHFKCNSGSGGGGGSAKEPEGMVVSSAAQKALAALKDTWPNARLTSRSILYLGGHSGLETPRLPVLEELAQKVRSLGGTVLYLGNERRKLVYPMDLLDESNNHLLVRQTETPYDRSTFSTLFQQFSNAKTRNLNSYDSCRQISTLCSATSCETYEMIPPMQNVQKELSSIFSSSLLKSAEPITVSGGNMLKLQGPMGKVLVIGLHSFENEFILSQMNTKNPNMKKIMKSLPGYIQKMTNQLRSQYALTEKDQLLIVPNNSYHLDLDVCSPRPGVVVVGSYKGFIDAPDKTLCSFQSLVDKKTKELGRAVNQNVKPLQDLTTVRKILEVRQAKLDEIQRQLEVSGIKVVRALGNLPLTMDVNQGMVYKTDGYELFNFLNGISMTAADGSFHYFCLATYEELNAHSSKFSKILEEMDVTCHFLGRTQLMQNHYELQKLQGGLHCMTAILSLEKEMILKKMGAEAYTSKNWTLAKKLYLQAHEINPGDYTCLSNAALMAKNEQSFIESIDLSTEVLKAHDLGKPLKEGLVAKNTKWIQDCKKALEKTS